MNKPEWLTLNAAAELDDCPVTGETLRQMIKRGDVPDECWKTEQFATDRIIYFIDATCIADLPYRYPGQRGKSGKSNN